MPKSPGKIKGSKTAKENPRGRPLRPLSLEITLGIKNEKKR